MKLSKHLTNSELADLLRTVAAALELSPGDNKFRIVAYQRAADSIEHATTDVRDLWQSGQLSSLAGVGETISRYLNELFTTGKVRHFNQIKKSFPPALFELLKIPGIGPKSALALCKALGISQGHTAISKLYKAAKQGQVASITGFGTDSQQNILQGISQYQHRSHRLLLNQAENITASMLIWINKLPNISQVKVLGSFRRQTSTIGDIDIAVASNQPVQVLDRFTAYPQKRRILDRGDHKASLILADGHQADIMVQTSDSFGSLLQHFTGSKHHNIALREFALKKGLSLSEYGIKVINKKNLPSLKLKEGQGVSYDRNRDLYTFTDETSFYNFLGLDYIPPELREDTGEIQAARSHSLPDLIELSDLTGDLHIHSNFNTQTSHDLGQSSIDQLARQSALLGYRYIGLAEHNPAVSTHNPGQIRSIIKAKSEAIMIFNQASEKHHENILPYIFNGLEIDIGVNGQLAVPEDCLTLLDYACVSVHSSFSQSRKIMTNRILSGLSHPKVRFMAHPTARLLGQREEIDADWDMIFDFCVKHHKWLEIDSWPNRLDLPDYLVRQAVPKNIPIIINSDSHHVDHLKYLHYGVSVARRGWATKSAIVNTVDLTTMRKLLKGGD